MTSKNIRFWEFIIDDWVKITLRPGQTLGWSQSGPTDEGWHVDCVEWTHEGDYIRRFCVSDGVDCDGRLTRESDQVCNIDQLEAVPCACADPKDRMFRPKWEEINSSQYDQYAQLAGY